MDRKLLDKIELKRGEVLGSLPITWNTKERQHYIHSSVRGWYDDYNVFIAVTNVQSVVENELSNVRKTNEENIKLLKQAAEGWKVDFLGIGPEESIDKAKWFIDGYNTWAKVVQDLKDTVAAYDTKHQFGDRRNNFDSLQEGLEKKQNGRFADEAKAQIQFYQPLRKEVQDALSQLNQLLAQAQTNFTDEEAKAYASVMKEFGELSEEIDKLGAEKDWLPKSGESGVKKSKEIQKHLGNLAEPLLSAMIKSALEKTKRTNVGTVAQELKDSNKIAGCINAKGHKGILCDIVNTDALIQDINGLKINPGISVKTRKTDTIDIETDKSWIDDFWKMGALSEVRDDIAFLYDNIASLRTFNSDKKRLVSTPKGTTELENILEALNLIIYFRALNLAFFGNTIDTITDTSPKGVSLFNEDYFNNIKKNGQIPAFIATAFGFYETWQKFAELNKLDHSSNQVNYFKLSDGNKTALSNLYEAKRDMMRINKDKPMIYGDNGKIQKSIINEISNTMYLFETFIQKKKSFKKIVIKLS